MAVEDDRDDRRCCRAEACLELVLMEWCVVNRQKKICVMFSWAQEWYGFVNQESGRDQCG